jgi:hypothetical protein
MVTILTFLWDALDKGGISNFLFQNTHQIHCCHHTQVLHTINTFLIPNACSHGSKQWAHIIPHVLAMNKLYGVMGSKFPFQKMGVFQFYMITVLTFLF